MKNHTSGDAPRLQVLSGEQVNEIHLATLSVLERTGVDVFEEEAFALLKNAGCETDGRRVRITPGLVKKALATVPEKVTLYTRDGRPTVSLEDRKSFFGTGSDCPSLADPFTGERRPFTKEDVGIAGRVCDYLPNIDFVMSLGLVQDVPVKTSDRHQFEAMILNTRKPIVFTAHDAAGMKDIIEITALAAGGRERVRNFPSLCLYAEPVTPLKHIPTAVRKLLLAAEERIPVVYTPCPMSTATAPATMAGTLVVGNAEVLSGLVIHQLKNPGAPFIGGGVTTIMDPSTCNISYGAPELNLLSAAYADISHFYKIPMFGTCGCSDAKVLDEQAAVDSTISVAMSALSGANLVHDIGFLEFALCGSYEMVVLNDEIIGMVKRIMAGVEINSETLATEVIHKVGPGGNFLMEDHTLKHFRDEIWFPKLFDRQTYAAWAKEGKKSLGRRLNEKVRKIIKEYQPEPLSAEVKKAISGIVNRNP